MRVVARVTRSSGMTVVADIDFLDASGPRVARLEGYECVTDPAAAPCLPPQSPARAGDMIV